MKLLLKVTSLIVLTGMALPLISQTALGRAKRARPATPDKEEQQKVKAEHQRLAKDLLTRAYTLSADFTDQEKAFVAARLAQASTRILPEKSAAWAEEVFEITANLPADSQRGQAEMTAILAIAENNPERGLQLLLKMTPPAPLADGSQPPDMRQPTAMMLFQRYWRKNGITGLGALQTESHQLGESGIYPFMAMGPIIQQVAKKDPERAQVLTNDALSFFSRSPNTDMNNQQVAMFLRANHNQISKPLMKEVLTQLVDNALAAKDSSNSVASISTNGNAVTLHGSANLLLYQLRPLIRDIDPEWAKKIEEQSEELRAASITADNSTSSSGKNQARVGSFISGPAGSSPRGNPMEEMKAMEVDQLASSDPTEALKLTNEISDPVLRAATGARLAGDLNASDPTGAAELLKTAHDAMAASSEPADKLKILVGLAQAQAAMKDKAGFAASLDQAYVMAEELYRKAVDKDPTAPVMSRPGIESMARLTQVGIRLDSDQMVSHINNVRSELLQAMLLISAAQGLDPEVHRQNSGFRIAFRS